MVTAVRGDDLPAVAREPRQRRMLLPVLLGIRGRVGAALVCQASRCFVENLFGVGDVVYV